MSNVFRAIKNYKQILLFYFFNFIFITYSNIFDEFNSKHYCEYDCSYWKSNIACDFYEKELDSIIYPLPLSDYDKDVMITKFNEVRNDIALGNIIPRFQIKNMRIIKWNKELEFLAAIHLSVPVTTNDCTKTKFYSEVGKIGLETNHQQNWNLNLESLTFIDYLFKLNINEIKRSNNFKTYSLDTLILSNLTEIGCSFGNSSYDGKLKFVCITNFKRPHDRSGYLKGDPGSFCGQWGLEPNEIAFTGLCGLTGYRGPTGLPGDRGNKGLIGEIGGQGDTGEPGLEGNIGDIGATGDNGLKGVHGDQGISGDDGLIGEKGAKGVIGVQGKIGIKGIQGETGDQGDEGEIGAIIFVLNFDFQNDRLFWIVTGILLLGIILNSILLSLKIYSQSQPKPEGEQHIIKNEAQMDVFVIGETDKSEYKMNSVYSYSNSINASEDFDFEYL